MQAYGRDRGRGSAPPSAAGRHKLHCVRASKSSSPPRRASLVNDERVLENAGVRRQDSQRVEAAMRRAKGHPPPPDGVGGGSGDDITGAVVPPRSREDVALHMLSRPGAQGLARERHASVERQGQASPRPSRRRRYDDQRDQNGDEATHPDHPPHALGSSKGRPALKPRRHRIGRPGQSPTRGIPWASPGSSRGRTFDLWE